MKHLVTMAEQKGCHGGETKMVPRQHSGPGNSWRYRCKRRRADVRNMLEMVGWSRLPGSHGSSAWRTRRYVHEANGHGANIGCISYNTCIRSTDGVSGLYLRSVRFQSGPVRRGSSRSRVVEGSRGSSCSATVVVHVHSGSSGSRDGSRTWRSCYTGLRR